ncbi:hypothetical protein [Spiroplasma ixodetis]|uniref:hypothetical protein n=1 Tax=Spiroplasma ixodetis TaxID=2141 RepID=UPI002577C116|nr:hypothetical protein [Spiroplasma ixodetis]WJG70803.1 hypothetical protein SIXOD_v1c20490 [Spiroplasma ixodetis Y32]
MTNTEQEQYKKESSDIKKRRKFFRKFKLKRRQNISNENREISNLNLLIKQKKSINWCYHERK